MTRDELKKAVVRALEITPTCPDGAPCASCLTEALYVALPAGSVTE